MREGEKTMRLRRTGILTKVVIVVLLVYLATSLLDLRGQIQNTKEQQQTVSQQVEGSAPGQPGASGGHRQQR